ncbi:hypothetical protein N431DRAFT_348246 [Stipitochalara longipes BDJ]|nr:hypothetical protein N431DRAFT_348246 [Stipitochalara longipes BDJ]
MNKFLLIVSILTVDIASRDKFVGLLTGISQSAFANETGVLRYGVVTPRDKLNSTLLYTIEEYTNQDAFISHMATQQRPTIVTNLTYSANLEFVKPEVAKQQDPYLVLRETDYIGGNLSQSLSFVQAVVNASKNETGTLFCGAYTDASNSTRLFTLEATTSKEYFLDVHSQSQAYLNNEKNSWNIVNGTETSYLKLQGGFLYKGI